jgi:hypothetical protein
MNFFFTLKATISTGHNSVTCKQCNLVINNFVLLIYVMQEYNC